MRKFGGALLGVLALAGCVPRPARNTATYEGPLVAQQAPLVPAAPGGPQVVPAWWRSLPATTNEVFVGSTGEGAIWVDKHYRLAPGGTRVAFVRWEFPAPQAGLGYLSERYVEELDCDAGRSRVLETYSYTGRLAAGHVVHTQLAADNWTYMQPGSAIEGVARLVCPASAPAPKRHRAPPRKPPVDEPPNEPVASDLL